MSQIPQIAHDHGVEIRHGDFTNPSSLEASFRGADVLFLVSFPNPNTERWLHHKAAIDAAKAAGVKTVIYTSLMFGGETGLQSIAGVQQAHIKTTEYLQQEKERSGLEYVILREGIYAESWWLYTGYQPREGFSVAEQDSSDIDFVVPDDGPVAWVSWEDLGLGTAKILASYEEYLGQNNVRLTGAYTSTLAEIAKLVEKETGRKVNVKIVGKKEAIKYHEARKSVPEEDFESVHNWAGWHEGLRKGEAAVVDPLLEKLIGRKPRGVVEMAGELFVKRG